MAERYTLAERENGTWDIVDHETTGPVEINGVVLCHLERETAETLSYTLNYDWDSLPDLLAGMLSRGPEGSMH